MSLLSQSFALQSLSQPPRSSLDAGSTQASFPSSRQPLAPPSSLAPYPSLAPSTPIVPKPKAPPKLPPQLLALLNQPLLPRPSFPEVVDLTESTHLTSEPAKNALLLPADDSELLAQSGYTRAELLDLKQLVRILTAETLQTTVYSIVLDPAHPFSETEEDHFPPEKLARLELVSRQVETVKIDTSQDPQDKMLFYLQDLSDVIYPRRPLFAGLKALDVTITKPGQLDYFKELLFPAVRSVRLSCQRAITSNEWDYALAIFLSWLSRIWSVKEEEAATLVLEKLPVLHWSDFLIKLANPLPALTTLKTDDSIFSPGLFRALTASPQLTDFSAEILYSQAANRLMKTPAILLSHSFYALKKLDLIADVHPIKVIFEQLGNAVESIHLTTKCENIDFDLLDGLIADDSRWLTSLLETFSWSIEETNRDLFNFAMYDRTTLDEDIHKMRAAGELPIPKGLRSFLWRTLKPLYRCQALAHFSFKFKSFNRLALTDADLIELSENCKLLESLSIEWERRSFWPGFPVSGLEDEGALTLAPLRSISKNMMFLRSLKLSSLDAFKPVPIPPPSHNLVARPGKDKGKEKERARRTQAILVDLGHARLKYDLSGADCARIAAFFDELWPNITLKVDLGNWHRLAWEKVVDGIIALRWDL